MMKGKNLLPAIAAVLFAALLFTGCPSPFLNSGSDATFDDNGVSGMRKLNVNVTNFGDYVTGNGSGKSEGRSIFPDNWDATLDFYLYGTASDGTVYPATQVTLLKADGENNAAAGDKSGVAVLELEPKNWNLTLIGIKSGESAPAAGNVTSEAYLIARSHVDITRWSSTANFTLSTDGLTTPGEVDFNVTLPSALCTLLGDLSNWTITAGIYTENGTLVNPANNSGLTSFNGATDKTAKFSVTGVPTGYYDFTVELSQTFDGQEVTYSYSDKIHVIPGDAPYPDLTLPANLLTETPAAPTGVKVTKGDRDGNRYKAAVTWTDKSTTEQFFEIEVADITTAVLGGTTVDSLIADDTEWNGITAVSKVVLSGRAGTGKLDFINSEWYADGSVNQNSTSATLWLETGKFYAVRMRAATTDGRASDWAYTTTATTNIDGFGTANKYINLFTITYNKNGGSGLVNSVGGTLTAVKEYTYTGSGIAAEDGSSLKKSTLPFYHWNKADGNAYTAMTLSYDIELIAAYKAYANWEILDPKDRDFASGWVTYQWKQNTADAYANVDATVSKGTANKLKVDVTEDNTSWDYEKLWLVIDGITSDTVICSGNSNHIEFDCSSLAAGYNYQVMVCASTRNGSVIVSTSTILCVR